MLGPLEYGMFDEMGDAGEISGYVPRSATSAQCAISYCRTAFLDCITQSTVCYTTNHYFFFSFLVIAILLRS